MKYCLGTKDKGLTLHAEDYWNGSADYEHVINGRSDSDFAKDVESRKSVLAIQTFLNGMPITNKSKMAEIQALSVTEAELIAATSCVQEMMSHRRLLKSLGLRVKEPMILEMDNKGAIDLINNWNCGGRTRHIDVRYYYLRELKEQGIVKVVYLRSEDNSSDIFTKNLSAPLFDKHAARLLDGMTTKVYSTRQSRQQGESFQEESDGG